MPISSSVLRKSLENYPSILNESYNNAQFYLTHPITRTRKGCFIAKLADRNESASSRMITICDTSKERTIEINDEMLLGSSTKFRITNDLKQFLKSHSNCKIAIQPTPMLKCKSKTHFYNSIEALPQYLEKFHPFHLNPQLIYDL